MRIAMKTRVCLQFGEEAFDSEFVISRDRQARYGIAS